MTVPESLGRLQGKLIVSCQAAEGDPFRDSSLMARFAQATVAGGAAGVRANSPGDISAIRAVVDVPIIGIQKETWTDGRVLITPSLDAARQLALAGADIVAMDCTSRGHATGALERLARVRGETGALALADIATIEEALAAANAGADAVLSTLRGYTDDTAGSAYFDPEFIRELAQRCPVPVIAEGRIGTLGEARAAMAAGAFAVVVGTAITRPRDITRSFADAVESEYRRHKDERFLIGVDLGGTKIKCGLVSSRGKLIFDSVLPAPARAGRAALLDALKQAIHGALQEANRLGYQAMGVGIATAGWVDTDTGSIAYATDNLPGWTGTPVAEEIRRFCGLPVAVENDANALAVAEKRYGLARRLTDFVVITLGTGVGGGCYIGGKLNRGAHYFANAFGHIPLVPGGVPCTCGRSGCLEVYANAGALMRYASGHYESPEQIIQSAQKGEEKAREAIQMLGQFLARGCAILVGLLDPQALIFSGGLTMDNPALIEVVRKELRAFVPAWDQRHLEIVSSRLGYFGGVFGAAAVADG